MLVAYKRAVVAALAIATVSGLYYGGYRHGRSSSDAKHNAQIAEAARKHEAAMVEAVEARIALEAEYALAAARASAKHRADVAKIKKQAQGVKDELEKYLAGRDMQCGLDDDGLRLWNAANRAASAKGNTP